MVISGLLKENNLLDLCETNFKCKKKSKIISLLHKQIWI